VSGTEFNQRVVRPGAVQYRAVPIGRISREHLAKHIVGLIEQPRRALFMSRVYDVPVLLNQFFPEFVDWFSAAFVRRKRKKELPPSEETAPVHYSSSLSPLQLFGGIFLLVLIARLLRRR
jgi:hypothetical protein